MPYSHISNQFLPVEYNHVTSRVPDLYKLRSSFAICHILGWKTLSFCFHFKTSDNHNEPKMTELDNKTCHDKLSVTFAN